MDDRTARLDGLHEEMAGRFGALGRLFGELGTPEAARMLFDSLTSDDPSAFDRFADHLDLPMLGKCWWLRSVVESVLRTPTGQVQDCWLREDLTPAERSLYLQIALRYRNPTFGGLAVLLFEEAHRGFHQVIPPGPFLDELRANGLIECEPLRATFETSVLLALSPPERVCV
jgi:hypothetical protein